VIYQIKLINKLTKGCCGQAAYYQEINSWDYHEKNLALDFFEKQKAVYGVEREAIGFFVRLIEKE